MRLPLYFQGYLMHEEATRSVPEGAVRFLRTSDGSDGAPKAVVVKESDLQQVDAATLKEEINIESILKSGRVAQSHPAFAVDIMKSVSLRMAQLNDSAEYLMLKGMLVHLPVELRGAMMITKSPEPVKE